jgi:protein TonB
VETEPGRVTDRAAPDALLGARTQTVDRQTVSRRSPRTAGTSQQTASKTSRPADQTKTAPLSQLGVNWLKPGQDLSRPTASQPQWAPQGAQLAPGQAKAHDYIKGMKEGEQTALNTREFVFYGYFQRIRASLDRAWNKTLRENLTRLFRRGRRLASEVDHTTRTLVVLNSQGRVLRVQILEESGTLDLDDAAIRAFNEAGPFPNPPRGLIDSSGEIQVRWDFVLRN